ncbi:MAG: cupin domain-containing protein [Granulosicoccaceae bacterium]
MDVPNTEHINWPDGLSTQQFLDKYWQKKPLLIRQAFPDFQTPISADELAGLSLEEDIASRIIKESEPGQFMLAHGPFEESIYSELGTANWSLLVSDVDKHIPDLASWLTPFQFLPAWRIDDLMISFAPDGASVGAHVDQYDVFLLQGSGVRRWHYDSGVTTLKESAENTELRIIDSFKPDHSADLQPGDMLYLPPGVAHHGIAVGDDCTTWSIGFRAPSHSSIVNEFATQLMESFTHSRYLDPPLKPAVAGELHPNAIKTFIDVWRNSIKIDDEQLALMCGKLVTQNTHIDKLEPNGSPPDDDAQLITNPFSLMTYSCVGDTAVLFANGEQFDCSLEMAKSLFEKSTFSLSDANVIGDKQLLVDLFQQGALIEADIENDDE